MKALDAIALRGIRARGRHGVLPAERELGQEFQVDVTLFLDTAPAAAGDDLALTVNYGELATRLSAVVEGEPVGLIEDERQLIRMTALAGWAVTLFHRQAELLFEPAHFGTEFGVGPFEIDVALLEHGTTLLQLGDIGLELFEGCIVGQFHHTSRIRV